MEEEDALSVLCVDVVSCARFEPALVHLFQSKRPGEWVPVAELCRRAGAPDRPIRPDLAVSWLTSPTNQPGYAVILFCDDELQWSMTAYYNAARLLEALTPAAVGGPVR